MTIVAFDLRVDGDKPMLMHSDAGVNPRHPLVKAKKELTSKRTNKTEDDQLEIDRLDYIMSFYYSKDTGPYLPGQNVFRALIDAGRITRDGKKVERGVQILTDQARLSYLNDKIREPEEMWAYKDPDFFVHAASVGVSGKRIMRYRPIFHDWSATFSGMYDTEIIDANTLSSLVDKAGRMCGVGDWRPRFGLFTGTLTIGEEVA